MPLTIHHLHASASERLVWLCEELSIPYELKTYNRAPLLAPPEYKSLHPSGTSPVIQDGSLTLAETGACIEYLCHKYAGGKLFLAPTHTVYAEFLYWWHWANGTFQPSLMQAMVVRRYEGVDVNILQNSSETSNISLVLARDRLRRTLCMLDERLAENKWLAGGEQFTVADVMVVFSLTTMRYFFPYSLAGYQNIVGYLGRVGEREAYRRAMGKCDPEMELALGAEPPERK